jgi:hypothetical protein
VRYLLIQRLALAQGKLCIQGGPCFVAGLTPYVGTMWGVWVAVAKDAISWALNALGRDKQRAKDAERLRQILTIDPEVLCLTQRERA